MVQPIIRGGKKLMIVKETLIFRRWLKFVNAVESYSEEIIRWIPITLQDSGMGFRYTAFSSTSGARAGCRNLGFWMR